MSDVLSNGLDRQRALEVTQRAILGTPMADHSRPVGWGLTWSAQVAEQLVAAAAGRGWPRTGDRDLQMAAFAGTRASDGRGRPCDWDGNFVRRAVDAALQAVAEEATADDPVTVLLAVEWHLAQLGIFLRTETPTAVGTVQANDHPLAREAVHATSAT